MKRREYFLYAKKIKITTFLKQFVSSLSLLITVAPFWILPIEHFCMGLNARMHYFHSNQSVNACRICILVLRRMQNSIRCLHSMGNIQNCSTVTMQWHASPGVRVQYAHTILMMKFASRPLYAVPRVHVQSEVYFGLYTTTISLKRWDTSGWIHAFMFFTPNSDPTIWMSQQKSRLIRPVNVFPIVYFGEPVRIITSWQERHPVGSSAAVAHPLQGSTCCGFRDGILHTYVVTSGYLSFCCLSIISNQFAHSPLTSDINKAFSSTQLPLTGYSLFFRSFSVNPRDGCAWKSQ